MMPTQPRRRWFQFSLRELFWLALVVALIAVAMIERRQRVAIESKAVQMEHVIHDHERRNDALQFELGQARRKAQFPGMRTLP